jgi:hypothetical protein
MKLEDNLGAHGDRFYADLMAAHSGLSEAESQALNARLVLIMANEIGSPERLEAILTLARNP